MKRMRSSGEERREQTYRPKRWIGRLLMENLVAIVRSSVAFVGKKMAMDQAKYFRTHPPRCIASFAAAPVTLPDFAFEGHSPASGPIEGPQVINTAFSIACKCGCSSHYVHGYRWANPERDNAVLFLSPLVLECSACGKTSSLLDTDVHGYDGEQGCSATARGLGEPKVFECSHCGSEPFGTCVRFEYDGELFAQKVTGYRGREQDLFSWFTLLGRCVRCSTYFKLVDFECA